jgi:CRP/FNR family transcriptional regulator, cyclic AMP receptor protein
VSVPVSCTPPQPHPVRREPSASPIVQNEPDDPIATRVPAGTVRLLDHLPDLASDLGDGQATTAYRALTVPAIVLGPGRCDAGVSDARAPFAGGPFGLVVAEGLLARQVGLGDRTSISLYGPGDVLDLRRDEGSSLAAAARLKCPETAVIALLDDRVLAAMREWPRMIARLFAIAMRQLERADINAAIGRLERVEDRLLGFFWLLADRWGTRGPDGIAIDLPLTHEAIGHLIGARRPTVSLGLRGLYEQNALRRREDGTWLLSPDSLSQLIAADLPRAPVPR